MSEYRAKWRRENKERRYRVDKEWRERNLEKHIKYKAEHKKRNPEAYAKYALNWKRNNKERVHFLENKRTRKKRETDPSYKSLTLLRASLWKALKSQNAIKSKRTTALIGCSANELKLYLESLFEPGMTWENYGKWHIDHIKPCAMFDFTDPKQQEECFHYTNLQPLWAVENIKKSSYFEGRKYFRKDLSV